MATGRRLSRRPDETANSENIPPELSCLSGAMGPYIKSDKAEFHHAGKEAQEWFLRMDAEDVAQQQYAAKLGFWVRTGLRWARWGFWAFTAGLGAALTIGEKLQKLSAIMSDLMSTIRGFF